MTVGQGKSGRRSGPGGVSPRCGCAVRATLTRSDGRRPRRRLIAAAALASAGMGLGGCVSSRPVVPDSPPQARERLNVLWQSPEESGVGARAGRGYHFDLGLIVDRGGALGGGLAWRRPENLDAEGRADWDTARSWARPASADLEFRADSAHVALDDRHGRRWNFAEGKLTIYRHRPEGIRRTRIDFDDLPDAARARLAELRARHAAAVPGGPARTDRTRPDMPRRPTP